MLEIRDVNSFYGTAHVLHGVSLTVPEGRLVALLGRNGMGKTTLIRSIMGIAPPQIAQGSIKFEGKELVGLPPNQIARLGLGLVPQGRRVFKSLSVVENLTMAARTPENGNGNGKGLTWTLDRVFQLFPRLAERKQNRGSALSGGEQQMLAIARALMTNPRLLVMDEPSEGLAPVILQQLGKQLTELKGMQLSILLVEQNFGLAMELADEAYILDRGETVYHGTPAELVADTDLRLRYLGVA